MKISAVFDTVEAADSAAAAVQAVMPTAHRRTQVMGGPPPERGVFYPGLVSAAMPSTYAGVTYSPEMLQGMVPYPLSDVDVQRHFPEPPPCSVCFSIEVGAAHAEQARDILINHHARDVRIGHSHL